MTKVTFQQFFDDKFEDMMVPVFPDRRVYESKNTKSTSVRWHQFISEEDLIKQRLPYQPNVDRSACGDARLADAEFPERLKRGKPAVICLACAAIGPLNAEEMQALADESVAKIFEAWDQRQ